MKQVYRRLLVAAMLIVVLIGAGMGVRAATNAHAAGTKSQCRLHEENGFV